MRRLLALTLVVPALLVGGAMLVAPDPQGPWRYPLAQRLLYVHVPLAWSSYVGYAGAVVAALAVLTKEDPRAGRLLRAAIEATCVLATAALLTGFVWGAEFAQWQPLADPKVLTTMVLVAVLAGLWVLALSTPPWRRDRLVAAVALAGFASVPASYLASRLATSVHPDFTRPESSLDASMWVPLLVATAGMLLLLAGLVAVRTRILTREEGTPW